jgi:hypothetical protein
MVASNVRRCALLLVLASCSSPTHPALLNSSGGPSVSGTVVTSPEGGTLDGAADATTADGAATDGGDASVAADSGAPATDGSLDARD